MVDTLAFRAEDRLQIMDLMYRWARALDRAEWDSLRSCFAKGSFEDHGPLAGGLEGLIAWLEARKPHLRNCAHQLSNILVDFIDDDSAVVESYVVGHLGYKAGAAQYCEDILGEELAKSPLEIDAIIPGRYVDHVIRSAEGWLISRRTVVYESVIAFETVSPRALNTKWKWARRDRSDALFEAFDRFGIAPMDRGRIETSIAMVAGK